MEVTRLSGLGVTLLAAVLGPLDPVAAATIHVPADQPTIQAGIAAARPGDTVLVACGTYTEHDIALAPGVSVVGESSDPNCVIIDAKLAGRVMFGSQLESPVRIEGVTLTGGAAYYGGYSWPGGGLYCSECALLTVINCVFLENHAATGGGLAAENGVQCAISRCSFEANTALAGGALSLQSMSQVDITDCAFTHQFLDYGGGRGGALLIEGSKVSLAGSTVAFNTTVDVGPGDRGGGVYVRESTIEVADCTFAYNQSRSGGAIYCAENGTASLQNTILALNRRAAIECGSGGRALLSCCDVVLNWDGDWAGCLDGQLGIAGNFSADPLFCDAEADNFALDVRSPCAAGNSPPACGLIGALTIGCDAASLDAITWGSLKALFKQHSGSPHLR